MKNKKILSLITFTTISSSSLVFALSCSHNSNNPQNKSLAKIDYDFGLATEPLNNLNYIKYKSMDKILPSLVDSFLKTGPSDELKSIVKSNDFNMVIVDTNGTVNKDGEVSSNFNDFYKLKDKLIEEEGYGRITGSYYGIQNFSTIGGLGRASIGELRRNSTIYAFRNPKNPNNYMGMTGFINKKLNRWSNGDYITAQDLRDYLEYIFDLSTGSQKVDQVQKFGIRGAEKFLDAQKDYIQKFNKSYKNPWGRRSYVLDSDGDLVQNPNESVWQSQTFDANNNPIDTKEVQAIKEAALNFGFYTGQLFLDYSNEEIEANLKNNPNFSIDKEIQDFTFINEKGITKTKKIVKNAFVNPYQIFNVDSKILSSIKSLSYDENSFTIIFDENQTPGISFFLFHVLSGLYPVNRKYIETEGGGIDEYGSNTSKFLTGGSFNFEPSDIVLGPQGYIILNKNEDYFDAENTISNKIKIYFSTDRNTNSTFFEDGYISQTYIPAEKINQYWSSPGYKEYLNKNTGYGTIAFGFNLDNETNGDSYIMDQDLRNAIYYAIDREKIMKIVGWDFSFPVNTWTAYGQYRTFDGKNIETYFFDLSTKSKDNVEIPLQNYDYVVHLSKGYTFEKTQRGDIAYKPQTSEFYINRFKEKYPNLKNVSLTFLNNSTDEQKKAGTYLKEILDTTFKGYVKLEIKSLPENSFASFIEEGKYDIIYQNYDRLGGNGAQDYVSVFFKTDEIDSLNQKSIGFKSNPVGSFTYSDYVSDLYKENNNIQLENYIHEHLGKYILNIINNDSEILNTYNSILKQTFENQKLLTLDFQNKYLELIFNKLSENNPDKYNLRMVKNYLEYKLINHKNIKLSRLKRIFNELLINIEGLEKISNNTNLTAQRLNFQQSIVNNNSSNIDFWTKFIELSYIKLNETTGQYTDRLNAFFSGNFTTLENTQKWSQEIVYVFIGELEKVIRDASPVIPLMEVDTNWEITRVGGAVSLFNFALQHAYDFTKPPRPGLPRKKGN